MLEAKGSPEAPTEKDKILDVLRKGGKLLKKLDKAPSENNVLSHSSGSLGGIDFTDAEMDQLVADGAIEEERTQEFTADDQVYFPGKGKFVFYKIKE